MAFQNNDKRNEEKERQTYQKLFRCVRVYHEDVYLKSFAGQLTLQEIQEMSIHVLLKTKSYTYSRDENRGANHQREYVESYEILKIS